MPLYLFFAAFTRQTFAWKRDTLYPGSCNQPRFQLLTMHQRIETDTRHSATIVVVIFFLFITWDCGKKRRHCWESHACVEKTLPGLDDSVLVSTGQMLF